MPNVQVAPQVKTYAMEFTEQELNVVLMGLSELQLKVGYPLVQKIHQIVREQNAPAKETAGDEQPK